MADTDTLPSAGGIVVSATVLERFVSVLERLDRRLAGDSPQMPLGSTASSFTEARLLTIEQVAERLGKSPRDVYRLVRSGKLRKVPNLGKRTTRFRPADVERMLAAGDEKLGRRRL